MTNYTMTIEVSISVDAESEQDAWEQGDGIVTKLFDYFEDRDPYITITEIEKEEGL